jgi:hypothetical protein
MKAFKPLEHAASQELVKVTVGSNQVTSDMRKSQAHFNSIPKWVGNPFKSSACVDFAEHENSERK